MVSRTASCSCGQLCVQVEGEPRGVGVCHCLGCQRRGTTVFHTEVGYDKSVSVAVGGFADPQFPAPQVSVYDCRRHPWVDLPDGITRFEKDPP